MLVIAALLLVTFPAIDAWLMRQELREQMRLNIQRVRETPLDIHLDVQELISSTDDASAALELQTLLQNFAQASGFELSSLRVLGYENIGDHQSVWVELRADGDLQALVEFLSALEGHRPIVLVRDIALAGGEVHADRHLSIRLEAGSIFDRVSR